MRMDTQKPRGCKAQSRGFCVAKDKPNFGLCMQDEDAAQRTDPDAAAKPVVSAGKQSAYCAARFREERKTARNSTMP
jgi:hypothetical protein